MKCASVQLLNIPTVPLLLVRTTPHLYHHKHKSPLAPIKTAILELIKLIIMIIAQNCIYVH